MKRFSIESSFIVIALVLSLALPDAMYAQNSFRLKRTKKESIPINVALMAGYNGMSEPADILQDKFENTNLTSIGGLALGLQAMIELDTVLVRIWVGAEGGYYRMMKRALYDDPGVHYIGEEGPVEAIESLWGIGANAFVAFGPVAQMTLLLGGGMQYQDARLDKQLPIEGTLTEDRIIPVALAALNVMLLEYDHGSIDAQLRGLKGFGDYGNIQFQSMLAFTFNF
ncbi:MAG: hypothetical protein IH600_17645 [Bacteroidetes bacterium]|nr:hypothetical protein [Bacteroidota bacterium]